MERPHMEAEAIGAVLARTNAALNLSSTILLVSGWVFIRRKQVSRLRVRYRNRGVRPTLPCLRMGLESC